MMTVPVWAIGLAVRPQAYTPLDLSWAVCRMCRSWFRSGYSSCKPRLELARRRRQSLAAEVFHPRLVLVEAGFALVGAELVLVLAVQFR
jgi:hypothetical protein